MRKFVQIIASLILSSSAYAQVSSFPHFTDFESESLCGTSCTGSCNPVGHWRNADQYSFPQAGTDWLVEDGATPSTATGPDFDHTTGTGSGKYMYTESSGCNNVTAELVSGIYDFSAVSAPRISFWYHMYGATMGVMHLDVDSSGSGNWNLDVVPSWTANVNAWQFADFSLVGYANEPNVRIRIRMVTGSSFTSDAAIDDITVYQPLANDIDAISVSAGGGCGNSSCTPVNFMFTNMGSSPISAGTQIPLSFEINSVVTTDTLITTSNILPGDTVTYTFVNGCADLSGPTSVLIDGWVSWPSDLAVANDSASTTTLGIPIIATYPYYQDFETGQNGWRIFNGNNGTWAFGTPAKPIINSAASGVNAFVTGGLTGSYVDNENSYVEGPCFDFTNVCDPVLSMNVWWNAEFSWDGMNVTISTDGGNTWQLVGAFGDPVLWYNDNTVVGNPGGYQSAWSGRNSTSNGSGGWVNVRHRLTGAGNMSNVKIRINFGTDASVTDEGVAFDDVRIFNAADLGADMTVCAPATQTLSADNGNGVVSYLWNTGATTATLIADSTAWYWVEVTTSTCVVRDSMYFVVVDTNTAVSLGPDSLYCSGNGPVLDAGYWPGATFLWSTGDTTQTIATSASAIYSVQVRTACDTLMDTVSIVISNGPVVNLGPDANVCDATVLSAGAGAASYSWNTGDTTMSINTAISGTYIVTAVDSVGCGSSDTITISVFTSPSVTVSGTSVICNGDSAVLIASGATAYMWMFGPADSSNTVMPSVDSTFWVVGADSSGNCYDTASFTVNVNPTYNLMQTVSLCYGDSLMVGNNVYYSSGSYSDTLSTMMGCDSIVNTMLTIAPTAIVTNQTLSGCAGFTVTVGNNTYNATGVYTDTLTAINGCDSTVVTDLTVSAPVTTNLTFSGCIGDSIVVGNSVYYSSGTYNDTLTAVTGCDSIVISTVTITTVNVAVNVTNFGGTLVAAASGAQYQWINCEDNTLIISATMQSYSASADGQYAVIVNQNGCVDTSTCYTINNVGIEETDNTSSFGAYPNPVTEVLNIRSAQLTDVVIYNAIGEVVYAQRVQGNTTIDMSGFEGGIYFIRNSEGQTIRVIKQ
ncbi:MAG: T9SS type A sorting domain-containing protein [Bacteroidia bacterium]|nr:T9SS type A sorting domain-containing protein [Bacteroidia bacterium]